MNDVTSSCRDASGVLWWLGGDGGVRWESGRFHRFPHPEDVIRPVARATIRRFLGETRHTVGRDGALYAAFEGKGLFALQGGAWRLLRAPPEEVGTQPTAAFTDGEGRIWFGYSGGRIVVIKGPRQEDVSFIAETPVGVVKAIGGRRDVWIAGANGVAVSTPRGFRAMAPALGPPFRDVSGVEETPEGDLWLCERRGIVHVPAAEVRRFLGGFSHPVAFETFDALDGLPGRFTDTRTRSRIARGADGRLWFVASDGIAAIDPARVFRNPVPPPVSIRSLVAEGRRYAPAEGSTLPARTRSLQIGYTALSLTMPERVRFRYQLEGVDPQWQEVGVRRDAFYTNLRPGEYRFRVVACNNDGVWNERGASLAFAIAPAWFQTTWFLLSCVASGLLVVWALYHLRMRQVARALSARFDERLNERTRIARELHDTLLQTVQASKLVAEDALEKAGDAVAMQETVEKLTVWLGKATDDGRAALNSLRASTTQTNDLAAALRRLTEDDHLVPSSLAVTFFVEGNAVEMHPIAREEICRIADEAIRNACAHSRAKTLVVNLKYAHELVLTIRDDGVGIEPSLLEDGRNGHFGVLGMRERAKRLGGRLTIVSSAARGTLVTLVVPPAVAFTAPATQSRISRLLSALRRR